MNFRAVINKCLISIFLPRDEMYRYDDGVGDFVLHHFYRHGNKAHTRVIRPNQTKYNEFSMFWLKLGISLDFLRFRNTGMRRITSIFVPTPNPYPNPSRMQKIILCWYAILFCLIIAVLKKVSLIFKGTTKLIGLTNIKVNLLLDNALQHFSRGCKKTSIFY